MSERKMVSIRVPEDALSFLRDAAKRTGVPLTEFLVKAAMKEAQRVAKPRGEKRRFPSTSTRLIAPPKFFRIAALEARLPGGAGYRRVGALFPKSTAFDEHELRELHDILDDDRAVFDFLRRIRPEHMTLVPTHQRTHFLEGLRRSIKQHAQR
jgi:hypothetical protein